MRRVLLLLLVALVLPTTVWANTISIGNAGGVLTGSTAGLFTSTSSSLVSWNGTPGSYGTLSFSTGALLSGDLANGGTFAGGGSFVLTANNSSAIFTGTFAGPVQWQLQSVGGNNFYVLTGTLTGTWSNGQVVNGATTQLTISLGSGHFTGSANLAGGISSFTVVPEPGTLGLMGTGLVSLAGLVRRKLRM